MKHQNNQIKRGILNCFVITLIFAVIPLLSSAQDSGAAGKAKNTLEVSVGLQGSLLQANDAWLNTSGGDNSIALLSSFSASHVHEKNDFRLESKLSARFGYNRISSEFTRADGSTYSKPVWFKNQDELNISLSPTMKISDRWSYGATATFRTQFALGYVSRQQQERDHIMSGFMAPGYLDISGGVVWTYPKDKMKLSIRLSPVAMSAVYVCNDDVRDNFVYQFESHEEVNFSYTDPYGVYYKDSSKYEGGSSVQIDFEIPVDKKGVVVYKSSLYSFYGWFTQLAHSNTYGGTKEYEAAMDAWTLDNSIGEQPMLSIRPTVRWENQLDIKMTKILSATIDYRLYFDRAQDYGIQTQTLVNIGLVYTFKGKPQK